MIAPLEVSEAEFVRLEMAAKLDWTAGGHVGGRRHWWVELRRCPLIVSRNLDTERDNEVLEREAVRRVAQDIAR